MSGSAAPALSLHQRPVWLLEEMQGNALFSRQRSKLGTEEEEVRRPLRSISGDTRVTRVAVTRVPLDTCALTGVIEQMETEEEARVWSQQEEQH